MMVAPWPALSENLVLVWYAQLDQLWEQQPLAWQSLSADEQARAARFHFEQHRRRFIASHFFLRSRLAVYLGQAADQIQFCYGQHGKPALLRQTGGLDLRFNLAHSDNLAVVGLTVAQDLGVDVERISPLRDAQQIARRFFSDHEQTEFDQLPPEQKLAGFYYCWTRKEAFIKARGDGLAYPLSDFDVSLTPGQPAQLLRVAGDLEEARHWSLVSFRPAPDYIAAVAIRRLPVSVDICADPAGHAADHG